MTLPPRLVVATGNPGKVAELAALLTGVGVIVDWRPSLPSPPEDTTSYAGNAVIKALAAARATGEPAIGDDSGVEVEALGGAPGLDTRPWAEALGGWNAARAALAQVAGSRATFRCALAVGWPDGTVRTADGAARGVIVPATGDGVGLEPCFVVDGTDRPLAALAPEVRDRVHHRSVAFRALLALRA
ncbi:MAG: non-canonical purine NTP pyrophosphatase [Myxococcota bacterium]